MKHSGQGQRGSSWPAAQCDRYIFAVSCVILAAALSGMLAGVALAYLGSVSCL